MATYFSTFITGFESVVKKALQESFKDAKILDLRNGLVVYETNKKLEEIKNIRFLNNSFIHIKSYQNSSFENILKEIISNGEFVHKIAESIKTIGKSYRFIFSLENELKSVENQDSKKLENALSKFVRLDKADPDSEIWFLKRSEGDTLLGIRITRPATSEKHLAKGELRHELANLLHLFSEPDKEDVFLDPFSGSGSIVFERIKSFPVKKIFAGEKDIVNFRKLQEKFKGDKNVVLGRWDATNLSSLTNGVVDRIVTDPPWGFYEKEIDDIEEFYLKVLDEFFRVLKSEGVAVILMGQKEKFESALNFHGKFSITEKLGVLVSGKKASVYKIQKLFSS